MTEDKRSIIQMVAGLIEQGKKNQDKIAYSKILDTFSGVEISSEQFDNILKVLEDNKIEVLRSKNDMEQTVSLSAKEKEPDEADDEELEESKILLDIDDDIEEDSEENIEEDLSVMEGGGYHGSGTSVFKDESDRCVCLPWKKSKRLPSGSVRGIRKPRRN